MTPGQPGSGAAGPGADRGELSYDQFGRRLFELAVTPERVRDALAGLAGRQLAFGPLRVGPARLIRVSATGSIGAAQVRVIEHEHRAFEVRIPLQLRLIVDFGLDKGRFTANVVVHLYPVARPVAPLAIVLDVPAPTAGQITVDLRPDGASAVLLQRLAPVDREVGKAVAGYVAGKLAEPEFSAARTIDVAKILHRTYTGIGGEA